MGRLGGLEVGHRPGACRICYSKALGGREGSDRHGMLLAVGLEATGLLPQATAWTACSPCEF